MADHKGTQVPSLAPNYYDAVYMVKEERKKIADYLQNVKGFKGLLFEWDNVNGVAMTKPTYIFEVKDGKKKLVLEVKPKF